MRAVKTIRAWWRKMISSWWERRQGQAWGSRQFLSWISRVYLDQEKWDWWAEMENERRSRKTTKIHIQHSWTCLWPCPQVAYVLVAKMRHGCSDNSRQAVRNGLQLLGSQFRASSLSQRQSLSWISALLNHPTYWNNENGSSLEQLSVVIHLFPFVWREASWGEGESKGL